jgi:hypothetical protein
MHREVELLFELAGLGLLRHATGNDVGEALLNCFELCFSPVIARCFRYCDGRWKLKRSSVGIL